MKGRTTRTTLAVPLLASTALCRSEQGHREDRTLRFLRARQQRRSGAGAGPAADRTEQQGHDRRARGHEQVRHARLPTRHAAALDRYDRRDRKSVWSEKRLSVRVEIGGRRFFKKQMTITIITKNSKSTY